MTPLLFMLALFSAFVRRLRMFRVRALRLSEIFLAQLGQVVRLGLLLCCESLGLCKLIPHIVVLCERKQSLTGFAEIITDGCINEGLQRIEHPSTTAIAADVATGRYTYSVSHAIEFASARARRQEPTVPGLFSKAPNKKLELLMESI